MARPVAALALLAVAQALTCETSNGSATCNTTIHAPACYYSFHDSDAGCVPKENADTLDVTESGCLLTDVFSWCWCLTDDCNSESWASEFNETYVPPPMCWRGVAGANTGPTCDASQVYKDNEYKKDTNCVPRSLSNQCVENNEYVGEGDGCGDSEQQTAEACASYSENGKRSLGESFDGTDAWCRWVPALSDYEKQTKCEADAFCTFHDDRGDCSSGTCQGNCESSDSAEANWTAWEAMRGTDCEDRSKAGCFENNDWLGEAERCSQHQTQDVCLAQVDDCSEGVCSGNATSGSACSTRSAEWECGSSDDGCNFTKQCCQWLPFPTDPVDTCANKGAGTLEGMCRYNDGNGPPAKDFIEAGFQYSLFTASDKYDSKCSLVASFRVGKGSATALGSDKADLVASNCKASSTWKALAEHIGHTDATIQEYCQNFLPDQSAMAALAKHKPSAIIAAAKQGQFGAMMSGLQDLLYIVTAKPEFGECLFFAIAGEFGAAVCTCDNAGCNNKTSLEFIVDADKGPMRLLQFLDGSLDNVSADVNKVVSGLLDDSGKVNPATVGKVTEADVTAIMDIPGLSELTTQDELWGIIQDFQALAKAREDYTTEIMKDSTLSSIKVESNKVTAANAAAGCELYSKDGMPNTLCLETLSSEKLKAVAEATGLSADALDKGGESAATTNNGGSSSNSSESSPEDGVSADGAQGFSSGGKMLFLGMLGLSMLAC